MSLDLSIYKRKIDNKSDKGTCIWDRNITHNLGDMARMTKGDDTRTLYELLWRSENTQITRAWTNELFQCYLNLLDNRNTLEKLGGEWGNFTDLQEFTKSLLDFLFALNYEEKDVEYVINYYV